MNILDSIRHEGLRVVRGMQRDERALVLDCWRELWRGALASQREIKTLTFDTRGEELIWRLGRAVVAP